MSNNQSVEVLEKKIEQYKQELNESRNIIERQHTMYYNLIMSTHYEEQKRKDLASDTILSRVQTSREGFLMQSPLEQVTQ